MGKEKPATKTCKHCKTEIPYGAKICPQCRKKQGPGGCLIAIIIVVVIGLIGSCFGGSSDKTPSTATSITEPASITTEPKATSESTNTTNTDVETEEETEEASSEGDNVPTEYKSALKKAQTYSEVMHMSKQGIYNQLTSEYGEKFSTEAAQYAVDNMVADWNANALEKAKVYSDTMYMSKAGIYDQLISEYGELFTKEEAQYAIDNIDADWKANALEKAKTYQNTMSMSPAAIHDQLTSEYGEKFTPEEADYAIDNLN